MGRFILEEQVTASRFTVLNNSGTDTFLIINAYILLAQNNKSSIVVPTSEQKNGILFEGFDLILLRPYVCILYLLQKFRTLIEYKLNTSYVIFESKESFLWH